MSEGIINTLSLKKATPIKLASIVALLWPLISKPRVPEEIISLRQRKKDKTPAGARTLLIERSHQLCRMKQEGMYRI
jgi:hypothetical protein